MPYYDRLILYFNGASRHNPHGPAGCGWVLYEMDEDGAISNFIDNGNNYLGYGISNNQAEYQGLIDGLDYIYENNIGCYKIFIRGDSLIVINQMDGSYNVNSPNIIPYYNQAQNSLGSINADWYFFRHIPRHSNWEADSLANQAIDG